MKLVELLCLFLLMKACMANEPYCREYDYDEKLLSKMIRTEIALESLTREMKAMESTFESRLRQVTEDLTNKWEALKSRPVRSEDKTVGFTAMNLDKSKSNNAVIIFNTVKTNVGDSFNKQTGRFRCKIPGLYFFTAVILRDTGSNSYSYCHFRVNDDQSVFAFAHNTDSGEKPSGAAHLVIQLNEGDEVYLAGCRGLPAFISFPKMFPKSCFLFVVKGRDSTVKSKCCIAFDSPKFSHRCHYEFRPSSFKSYRLERRKSQIAPMKQFTCHHHDDMCMYIFSHHDNNPSFTKMVPELSFGNRKRIFIFFR